MMAHGTGDHAEVHAEILFAALDAVLQQIVDQVIGEMELIREKEDRLHIGGA